MYVSGNGSITTVGEERANLFTCGCAVSVEDVSSSSGCLRWTALLYGGTP